MNTYIRIAAVYKAIEVLKFLADQREPVSGRDVAVSLDLPVGTVMCHLVTLEDNHMVRKIGEHWELGDGMALLWARRKSQLEGGIDRMRTNLKDIGVDA